MMRIIALDWQRKLPSTVGYSQEKWGCKSRRHVPCAMLSLFFLNWNQSVNKEFNRVLSIRVGYLSRWPYISMSGPISIATCTSSRFCWNNSVDDQSPKRPSQNGDWTQRMNQGDGVQKCRSASITGIGRLHALNVCITTQLEKLHEQLSTVLTLLDLSTIVSVPHSKRRIRP